MYFLMIWVFQAVWIHWWSWWWWWNLSYTCLKSCLIVVFNQIFCRNFVITFFCHHIVLLSTFSFLSVESRPNLYQFDLIQHFQNTLWIIGIWATMSNMSTLENIDFWDFFADSEVFYISTLNILWTITSKPINHTIFLNNSIRSFRCT